MRKFADYQNFLSRKTFFTFNFLFINSEMNRGREILHQFLAENFGATIRNVTIWILEDVSKGMEKGIREIRLVEK